MGAASPPSRSSQWSLRVAVRGASSPPPPRPAFKKAGESWLESFLGFPTAYAGPPLTGSGGLSLSKNPRGFGGRSPRRL